LFYYFIITKIGKSAEKRETAIGEKDESVGVGS